MNEITKALEALDRIFNYCEEIDLHIPKEEQVGYDMLVDINIIREALGKQTSVIEELEKIKTEILKYHCIKCYDTCETYCPYNDCIESKDVIKDLRIIDKHISVFKGEDNAE